MKQRIRVLHLANHCHEIGNGIMNVAVDLACIQADLGHDVAFASAGGSYVALMQKHGVSHTTVDQPWRRPLKLAAALLELRRLIRRFQPDIVHGHMMTGALLGSALRMSGDFRLVTTVHNEWQKSAILMGVGDRVIAVSDAVSGQMRSRGIPSRKLRVVRNGPIGSPRRPPAAGLGQPNLLQRPAIVTVAGLYERKGINELISAFVAIAPKFPKANLYIVGDGPDRQRFEDLAAASSVGDRIHFTGFIADPRRYLTEADVFVLASRSEPFGLVLAEAREYGCAIVASNVGGIPEALDGGEAGMLIPPRDPHELARALSTLLADGALRDQWARRAGANLEWLHAERMVRETLSVYSDALGHDVRSRSGRSSCPSKSSA